MDTQTTNFPKPSKKLTVPAGTLFLVWLLFSPFVAVFILTHLLYDFTFLALALSILFTYLLLGIIYYRLCQHFGGIYVKEDNKPIVLSGNEALKTNDYSGLIEMFVLAIIILGSRSFIALGVTNPLFFGSLGLLLFSFTCLANWYSPLRKKVNYWLSFGERNELVATARAEPVLYALNGLFVVCSGFWLIACSLYFFH